MSHSWLSKKKKQELIDLSGVAGLSLDAALLKDEIVESLDEFLQTNATRLSKNASFEGYYGTGRRNTPFKIRDNSAAPNAASGEEDVKSVVKARGRKATKVKQEPEDDETFPSPIASLSSALSPIVDSALSPFSHNNAATSSRTPMQPTTRRSTRKPDIPASPSDVADIVEYESRQLGQHISSFYHSLGISDQISSSRDALSSVPAIHVSFLALEAFALLYAIIPWKFAFDVPANHVLHTPSYAVHLPDLFVLLTAQWWSTTFLWASVSILIPALFGYFFNLTRPSSVRSGRSANNHKQGYAVDPLTFSVVKALGTWLVYSQEVTFGGIISDEVVERIDEATLGGFRAVLIGCGVSGLASLYEAALRK